MLSRAMGLLGVLFPAEVLTRRSGLMWGEGTGGGGEGCTPLTACNVCLLAKVVDRYCFTCCLCDCWMWYLVGFSR